MAIVASWVVARAQDIPPQPDLDLPVRPEGYMPGAPAVPVRPASGDDAHDDPAPVFFGEEIAPSAGTLVYVVDVSGSMRAEDRLERAKEEARKSINGLPEALRFNVVAFDCTLAKLWPSVRPATLGNKAEAWAFVERLGARSGTATGPGVALALSDREVEAVVLLTDGAPNCGAVDASGHRGMIRNANAQGATIDVFGIAARGLYRAFCREVAADSRGNYYDVP